MDTSFITCDRHSSIRIEGDGKVIYVDPYLIEGEPRDADVIFLTHEHYDHLSQDAIDTLTKEGTLIYANAKSCDALGKGKVLANGDSGLLTDKIKYAVVPAYNTTEGRDRFHPKGNGNGYLFNIDGFVLYVAGDTETIPEMAALKNIYGPVDIAFLPVNQPYTMTVDQCVEAAKMIAPKVLVPYHFSATDLSALPSLLEGTGIEVRIHESLR